MKYAQSPNIKLRVIALIKFLRGVAALVFAITLLAFYKDNISISLLLSDQHTLRLKGTELYWLLSQILPFIEQHILVLSITLFLIVGIRFFEVYGLWFERRWGELLALITSLIYLPLEVMMLRDGLRPFPVFILIVNLIISYYLFSLLRKRKR
jgi:uncharacterized membrane protein (DUF2068 family)